MGKHFTVVLNYHRKSGAHAQRTYNIDADSESEAKSAAKQRLKSEYRDCDVVSVASCKERR